ncbi:MAG: zinc ribbon domain-containing protein [Deltaproteobacteria bacterium]|nr:MAG: zinc ribbon domain-containing protein [Deltaproteobacteria bacterium]
MALTKCKECGEQISTKADACPKCGIKLQKRTSKFTWIILILIIFGVYAANTSPTPSSSSSSANSGGGSKTKPAAVKAPEPTWETFSSKDEMTGKRSSYATSPTITPKNPMAFPYQDTTAWLAVGCNKGSEWAYIGFSKAPNLNDTETGDGYNVIKTRFKWNNTVETAEFIQKWGGESIHFENAKYAITHIASSSVAVLELDWHGQRPVHFEFPLHGASAALLKIRSECKSY